MIAVQMYNFRNTIKSKNDFFEALGKIKEIGYQGVEISGLYGANPGEIKEALKNTSLCPVSAHVDYKEFTNKENADKIMALYNEIGCQNVTVPWYSIQTPFDTANLIKIIQIAKSAAIKYGITVNYHNHTDEFTEMDGIYPADMIKQYCPLQFDTFWAFYAGIDPAAYIRKSKNRLSDTIHLKDGVKGDKPEFRSLGDGENNIKAIVSAAKEVFVEWLVVENDEPKPDPFTDAEKSFKYLKSII